MFAFSLPDPIFFAAAIPAVSLVGMSKGGLGGAFALIGVPLMAMVVTPVDAAAIFLPILIVMDLVALYAWRKFNDRKLLLTLLPGCIVGIALGWATSAYVPDDALRFVIAVSMILFAGRYFYQTYGPNRATPIEAAGHRRGPALFWGTICGLWQLRRPCRRPTLPDLRAAPEVGPEELQPVPAFASSPSSMP